MSHRSEDLGDIELLQPRFEGIVSKLFFIVKDNLIRNVEPTNNVFPKKFNMFLPIIESRWAASPVQAGPATSNYSEPGWTFLWWEVRLDPIAHYSSRPVQAR